MTLPDAPAIAFDIPPDSCASPPLPLVIRGHLPSGIQSEHVSFLVSLPGEVIDRGVLEAPCDRFDYVYDPEVLRRRFPNIDTRIEMPAAGYEDRPAWFDTVTFTFWAGQDQSLTAGMVLLQGEQLYAQRSTGKRMPRVPKDVFRVEASHASDVGDSAGALSLDSATELGSGVVVDRGHNRVVRRLVDNDSRPLLAGTRSQHAGGAWKALKRHNSLLTLSSDGVTLFAAHPWSGEVVRMDVRDLHLDIEASTQTGGRLAGLALSGDEQTLYVTLSDRAEILVLRADTLAEKRRFRVGSEPRAGVPNADGTALYVADFSGDRVLRVNPSTGQVEASSEPIDRPACLAVSASGDEVYTASFRTGELAVLSPRCEVVRRLAVSDQLNQCRTLTLSPEGLLFAPQTRSDTITGGRMFDRSVFPAIVVADPRGQASIRYSPDLLVVPPHRGAEVVVDEETVFLASAGSDDVLAIERKSGFARWHQRGVGLEPGAIALDAECGRLYVLTITGQEIVTLGALTGVELSRRRFTEDPTPPAIARGRYLFGTATDKRLTKDQWMSCAVCHPDGEQDGRQWDLGDGPLDTRSLRGSLLTVPLHYDGHLDEIQDTVEFTRSVMAGQWFVPRDALHGELGESNAGRDRDLDSLAAYIASLMPPQPPRPPDNLLPQIEQGRQLFFSQETRCAHCHPPPYYTDSGRRTDDGRCVLHSVGTSVHSDPARSRWLDTPSLLGLARSEPYLHDGRAKTLVEVFTKFNPADEHGKTSHLSGEQIKQLAFFLRYLGASAPAH